MRKGRSVVIASLTAVILAALLLFAAYGPHPDEEPTPSPWRETAGMRQVEAGGFRVNYLARGSGRPVLLLHGGGTWSYSFRHQVEALAREHRVYVFDMPGHGFTRRLPQTEFDFTLGDTDRFLASFLDAVGETRVSMVGNSWGGGWALRFAQTHPERVERLVLVGSAGLPHRTLPTWELMKWPVVGEALVRLGTDNDVREGLEAAYADPTHVTEADVAEVARPLRREEVALAQVRFMRGLDWSTTQQDLTSVRAPALVIWGAQDAYLDPAIGRDLAAALPEARFVLLPDAGHVPHEERPEAFNELTLEFLGPSWTAGSPATDATPQGERMTSDKFCFSQRFRAGLLLTRCLAPQKHCWEFLITGK